MRIDQSSFTNSLKGIQATSSKIKIENSLIKSLGAKTKDGGAILLENSESRIESSSFEQNQAREGGAISIKCKSSCKNVI